jgi:hypothetical protein
MVFKLAYGKGDTHRGRVFEDGDACKLREMERRRSVE